MNLQILNIFKSQLTELPPEIGQLANLRTIQLCNAQLTELPPEIEPLKALENLVLSGNRLVKLPLEIQQLNNLQYLDLNNNPIQDLSALANHPNQHLCVYAFGVKLPRRYWTHLRKWQPVWLLTEKNSEVRRVLIQHFGYERIFQELEAIEFDRWREYTLLKIAADVDIEPIHLLKMTCPSTTHIHVLRVPPYVTSARVAIRWTNWGIDPEAFATET
ncbi:leucine-rich repeat domain-containing protein [Microcoleus sp. FACHB-1515]|nr:leucine-rich repeat domain-containing protein [Microcoleus sp. FACHB-1515]